LSEGLSEPRYFQGDDEQKPLDGGYPMFSDNDRSKLSAKMGGFPRRPAVDRPNDLTRGFIATSFANQAP